MQGVVDKYCFTYRKTAMMQVRKERKVNAFCFSYNKLNDDKQIFEIQDYNDDEERGSQLSNRQALSHTFPIAQNGFKAKKGKTKRIVSHLHLRHIIHL